jgi:hypothetical protein
MDKLEDLKINKIIQEYAFLKTDESLKREMIQTGTKEFLEVVNSRLVNIDPGSIKSPTVDESKVAKKIEPKIDPELIDNNTKVKLKKIFREIVKHTHPDKTDSPELNELYIEAKEHYDTYDLFELYFIAKTLGVVFKLTLEESKILSDLIERKKNDIKQLEQSFIWIWINSETALEREVVVQSFIKTHYLA